MRFTDIRQLTTTAREGMTQGTLYAQVTQTAVKATRQGKPYLEITLADTIGSFTLKVWDNAPWHGAFAALHVGDTVAVTGNWQGNDFGTDGSALDVRPLTADEEADLLAGSPELRAKQDADWQSIVSLAESIADPRLRALCDRFREEFAARFRRAAAARNVHHARRGGLTEHTAGVMRMAAALCDCYPELNRDLVLAGALFHDCGKMWENGYEEHSLNTPYTEIGELMGHISLGIEVINRLWNQIMTPEQREAWKPLTPASEEVRLHLLHAVAAHHGTLEFGSPVVPKTPEALALHFADDTDAKMEIYRNAYATGTPLSDKVLQRKFPMDGNPVLPLPRFQA